MSGLDAWLHLDLKGAPPSWPYLTQLLDYILERTPLLRGLVVEYEDVFPYRGKLLAEVVSKEHAWTRDQVSLLNYWTAVRGLEVVPLVQTAGHLEYLLKSPNKRHLREVEDYPQCVNTARDPPKEVLEMLVQVLEAHREAKAIHVGGDEVWHLGMGREAAIMLESDPSIVKESLYLRYMSKVVAFVKNYRPGIRVLMWDDVLRRTPFQVLKADGQRLLQQVEPVIWNYSAQLEFPEDMWPKYSQLFAKHGVWGATAFKGASSPHAKFPAVRQHILNHASWKMVIEGAASQGRPRFQGVILTGWQRFDHFSVLCELLPVSVPSLVCCLKVLELGDPDQALSAAARALSVARMPLDSPFPLESTFPGVELYKGMEKFVMWICAVNELLTGDSAATWCTEWSIRSGRGSKLHIAPVAQRTRQLLEESCFLKETLVSSFASIYSCPVLEEWLQCFFEPSCAKLIKFNALLQSATYC